MQLIHDHIHHRDPALKRVALRVSRETLAKRRWRGVAADGAEFGFDVEHPLANGDAFFANAASGAVYVIEQTAEPVLEIHLPGNPGAAAKLGWLVGNLHFPVEVTKSAVRMVDDPALRQLCEREHLHFHAVESVFTPLSGGHSHSHADGHEHQDHGHGSGDHGHAHSHSR